MSVAPSSTLSKQQYSQKSRVAALERKTAVPNFDGKTLAGALQQCSCFHY